MTKHDESRRAFLVGAVAGAAAGAGAVATAASFPSPKRAPSRKAESIRLPLRRGRVRS